MTEANLALCVLLDGLADASDYGTQDVSDFYNASLEYARLIQSLGEKQELNDSEKECIQRSFPIAIQRAAELTNELAQSKTSDELGDLLSKIEAVTNDIFEVYKSATNSDVPSDVYDNIQKLQADCKNKVINFKLLSNTFNCYKSSKN